MTGYFILANLYFYLLVVPCHCTADFQHYVLASPTRNYAPRCRGDVVAQPYCYESDAVVDPFTIQCMQNWTAMGGSVEHQVFKLLYPLDGKFGTRGGGFSDFMGSSDGLRGHRIVAFDMRLASLKSLDVISGAYSVRLLDVPLYASASPS